MATINGTDLVLKFGTAASEVVVACSTSCTITINQATVDATCKDAESWANSIAGQKTWEMTVDALYQDNDAVGTGGFVDLSELIVTGPNTANVIFGNKDAPTTGNSWSGTAIMTTCSLNADGDAAATYSATFTGTGPLTYIPQTP